MITTNQMIAARGLLDWHQKDLAAVIGIDPSTLCIYERGYKVPAHRMTRIIAAFEKQGVEFLNTPEGQGVLLRNGHNGIGD